MAGLGADGGDGPGLAEAVASLLSRFRSDPSEANLDLLLRVAAKLSSDGLDDVERMTCLVAVTGVAVEAGVLCWCRSDWVPDVQARAQNWFLVVARESQEGSSVGLEQWLLVVGSALAKVVVSSSAGQASLVARIVARLANLAGDVTIAADLFDGIGRIEWSIDAQADVVSSLLELVSTHQPVPSGIDLGKLRDVAETLASSDALDAAAKGQLARALGAPIAVDPEVERITTTFGALFSAGDYRGASLVARRLAGRTNPRLVLLGTNLATLCELHEETMDAPTVAAAEVARLRYLASLPESEAFERSTPLASSAATLREIVAHQIGVGTSANTAVAALAAEALCDARVSRLTTKAGSSFLDQLARMATATRGTVSSPDPPPTVGGVRTHVVEMVLTADHAVLAIIETRGTESVGRLCSFFGTELRLLTKLVTSPRHAERLTERELERLRRCLGIRPVGTEQYTVIPSARLWTLPWERIIPGTRVAMCATPTRPLPAPWSGRLSVVAVGDPGLVGSEAELDTLRTLHSDGKVVLREADSLEHFVELLDTARPDVATIGVHGTGEGLSYRLTREAESLPLYRLLELRLPPLISVASCYSGSVAGAVNLAAVLTRSNSKAVVSLWDTLDAATSTVMSNFYTGLASGLGVADAWELPSRVAATLGLRLLGD